jgi:hypothetical protein
MQLTSALLRLPPLLLMQQGATPGPVLAQMRKPTWPTAWLLAWMQQQQGVATFLAYRLLLPLLLLSRLHLPAATSQRVLQPQQPP